MPPRRCISRPQDGRSLNLSMPLPGEPCRACRPRRRSGAWARW
uniref:Uncharacterized protein n=1 Tax=Arundo donax TaxID=35708 RepID=A0A0A9BPW0_ARUDO